jgi:enhancing lycopene biosynthesis protein 2
MKKIAVILSGCGVFDGAEIHEAVLTLLAIAKHNATYELFAPDVNQHHVLNHLTGREMPEQRNVLVEAARIGRGTVKPLNEYNAAGYDALVFPGGFGVAKNLCDYALKGNDYSVIPEVAEAIVQTHKLAKPIGALCISPVLLAAVLPNVNVTLGNYNDAAKTVESRGATHQVCASGEICVDKTNKIVSAPCYMLDANIAQIYDEANKLIDALLKMCG